MNGKKRNGMPVRKKKFNPVKTFLKIVCSMVLTFVILAGGASKSPVWSQLLADISGLPVRIPEVADLACVGAAVMAGVGCGIYPDAKAGYEALAVSQRTLQPDLENTKKFAPLFAEYKRKAAILGSM